MAFFPWNILQQLPSAILTSSFSLRRAFSPNHMHRNDSIVTLLVGRKTKEMTSDNQKAAHFCPVVIFDREPTTIYFHHESHGSYASMQWAYSANNSVASATKFACQSIKMCSLQSSDAIDRKKSWPRGWIPLASTPFISSTFVYNTP